MSESTENKTQQSETAATTTSNAPDPVRKWTIIILVLCIFLIAWYLRSDRVTPFTSQATVHALVVPITSEVSGTVTSVAVRNNQVVKAGQELFQVDTKRYQLAVDTAQANLEAARQAQGVSGANISVAEAGVSSATAALVRAEQDAVRMQTIREEDPGAISIRRLESAQASLELARGQLAGAKANVEKAKQDYGSEGDQNSRILQAQAALDQALLDLKRATVVAPEDGVVTGVNLDRGNFASAGAPQMTFISTGNIWIQAEYTENNLGNIDAGDDVEIVFDVLPGNVYRGKVKSMGFGVALNNPPLGSLPTIDNDRNWLRDAQRFPVLIDFQGVDDSSTKRLKVGSQASVLVYTGDNWMLNLLAKVHMRINAVLTYAY
jgi:multidrug resistance efflux pump